MFEKSWEYVKSLYTCFDDVERAHDLVPREKLWEELREHGVDGRLLLTVKSLYSCLEVCVRVGRIESRPFTVGVGLRQGSVTASFHSLHQGLPNYGARAASGFATSLIRPVKYLSHFFQVQRFRLWTAVQQH